MENIQEVEEKFEELCEFGAAYISTKFYNSEGYDKLVRMLKYIPYYCDFFKSDVKTLKEEGYDVPEGTEFRMHIQDDDWSGEDSIEEEKIKIYKKHFQKESLGRTLARIKSIY